MCNCVAIIRIIFSDFKNEMVLLKIQC